MFGVGFLGITLKYFKVDKRSIASAELAKNSEEELMRSLTVNNKKGESTVEMKLVPKDGKHICKSYDEIQIIFAAEGMAVSGEKPQVSLHLDCTKFQDEVKVVFTVPNQQQSKRKPSSQEFSGNKEGMVVSFSNVQWVWPRSWALETVNFKSQEGDFAIIHPLVQSDIKRIVW